MSNPRYFVNLLGRGNVEETLGYLEETHGEILVHDEPQEGGIFPLGDAPKGPTMNAKLHRSLCGKHIYGIVEIIPKEKP